MSNHKKLLKNLSDNAIDYATELLELGYSHYDLISYGLGFIYNQKIRKNLSVKELVDLETNYMCKVIAVS